MALAEEDRIVALVRENGASLLRLARRHSLCDDDAADAYQRTLEIYLRRVGRLDPDTAGAWLRTVCKHEAMRIRAAQQRVLPSEPVEWDERASEDVGDAADRAESLERVARAAEALGACAPDEARAILLCAGGSSYQDIARQCGWSYSRTSRTLAGGRRRFLRSFAALESGAACAALEPVLSAIVDGEADPDAFLAVRPHLRHCPGCRATLRALYEAEPALGALVPAGALAGGGGWLSRWLESVGGHVGDRVAQAHAALEVATSTKAVAVVASAATVAAGGAAVKDGARAEPAAARSKAVRAARTTPTPTPNPPATATATATPAPASPAAVSEPARAAPPSPAPVPRRGLAAAAADGLTFGEGEAIERPSARGTPSRREFTPRAPAALEPPPAPAPLAAPAAPASPAPAAAAAPRTAPGDEFGLED